MSILRHFPYPADETGEEMGEYGLVVNGCVFFGIKTPTQAGEMEKLASREVNPNRDGHPFTAQFLKFSPLQMHELTQLLESAEVEEETEEFEEYFAECLSDILPRVRPLSEWFPVEIKE